LGCPGSADFEKLMEYMVDHVELVLLNCFFRKERKILVKLSVMRFTEQMIFKMNPPSPVHWKRELPNKPAS